ncbi:glycoside hydrolase 3 protein [Pichia californica]|uniref:glucan 1,3-beta-glucosidase n=1 Tax=Pichia californica TaxID=460514 RepID=A0A9P7BG06_9ASCO|nr:glycoside hydrolase 3 protein [[Candida] californica]KAG0691202.1 glycoside hydrolase 3 protein [[Candida] californica]
MKLSATTLSTLALALAATPVNAISSLGFNLGVKDNSGNCKYQADYESDFSVLSAYTDLVKVYSVSDCNTLEYLAPAAESSGFKLTLGVWPTPSSKYELEKQALSTYLPTISKSTITSILVGSEALYRGDLTGDELASLISEIKSFISNINDKDGNSYSDIPVGTVDSWNILVNGEAYSTIQACDVVYANAFSYWQGQTQANSTFSFFDDIMQALQTVQSIKGSTDIEFWVGETGWPTDGSDYGASVPSIDNAATFWKEGICAMRGWGVNTFVFEAFDETWKPETSGSSVETHWGVFDDSRSLKYPLDCSFD